MRPVLLAIQYVEEKQPIIIWIYPGIRTNKWIYAKRISEPFSELLAQYIKVKDLPQWPEYIKVRKKDTEAINYFCEYCDEEGTTRYSQVQLLEFDYDIRNKFPASKNLIGLDTEKDAEIISMIDSAVQTEFYKNLSAKNITVTISLFT